MPNLKIILMYPNIRWNKKVEFSTSWTFHPYNLCLLSAMIDKEYDVKIVDATNDDLSHEGFKELIMKESPDIIGISMLASEYRETINIAARLIKEVNPKIKIISGGIAALTDPSFLVEDSNIDFIVRGEGEYVFREICYFLDGKGNLPKKGIIYRRDGETIDLGRADFISNLDDLPFPSYNKIDFDKYARKIQRDSVDGPRELPYARLLSSRGCPFDCCFCEIKSIAGKRTRFRSAENVLAEIDWLVKTYGVKSLLVDDDNFLIDKIRAKKIFTGVIEKGYDLKWSIPGAAVYAMDEEVIELMHKAGVIYINIAIESGDERVLKDIIHKPVNLDYAKKMIKEMQKYPNFEIAANFVIGFPGETWDEIRKTIKFAEDIDIDYVKIFIATPMPNTELYEKAKEMGYLSKDYALNEHLLTRGWINTPEFDSRDLQILRVYEWDRINFSRPEKRNKVAKMMGITEEKLNEIRRKTKDRVLEVLKRF